MRKRSPLAVERLESKTLMSDMSHVLPEAPALVHIEKAKPKQVFLSGTVSGVFVTAATPTGTFRTPAYRGNGTVKPLGPVNASTQVSLTSDPILMLKVLGKGKKPTIQVQLLGDLTGLVTRAANGDFIAQPESSLAINYTIVGGSKGIKNLAKSGVVLYSANPNPVSQGVENGTFTLTFTGH